MSNDQTQTELVQLVHASASSVPFSDEQLEELFDQTRKNNSGLAITGMLLFVDDTFFQVLE